MDDFCFFFSSRRRHTRYWRDWSSDVCSSDLSVPPRAGGSSATRACPFAFTSVHRALSVHTTTPPSSLSVRISTLPARLSGTRSLGDGRVLLSRHLEC